VCRRGSRAFTAPSWVRESARRSVCSRTRRPAGDTALPCCRPRWSGPGKAASAVSHSRVRGAREPSLRRLGHRQRRHPEARPLTSEFIVRPCLRSASSGSMSPPRGRWPGSRSQSVVGMVLPALRAPGRGTAAPHGQTVMRRGCGAVRLRGPAQWMGQCPPVAGGARSIARAQYNDSPGPGLIS